MSRAMQIPKYDQIRTESILFRAPSCCHVSLPSCSYMGQIIQHLFLVFLFTSSGIHYEKEWTEDKEIMKQTLPSANNLDAMATTESAHNEL